MTLIQYRLEMTWVFVLDFLRADLNPVSPNSKSVVFQRYQMESWGVCQGLSSWHALNCNFSFSSTVRLPKVLLTFLLQNRHFGLTAPCRLGFSKYPEGKSSTECPGSLFCGCLFSGILAPQILPVSLNPEL